MNSMKNSAFYKKHLTIFDGYILYTTSVIGLGLIILPSISARLAGPYSIVIWASLSVLSYAMGYVMARLASSNPSAGGVIEFIKYGLGKKIGYITAFLYLSAIFVGAPATGLFFAEYLSAIFGINSSHFPVISWLFLLCLTCINLIDVRRTMRYQSIIFIIFVILISSGVIFTLPHVSYNRLADISGYQVNDILSVPLICFFAFVGLENAAFSSQEFKDKNTLHKSLLSSVVSIAILFTMLSVVTVGALDRESLKSSNTSLSDLFYTVFGPSAEKITAFLAIIIIFLMMISWVRGAGRLAQYLSEENQIPACFSSVHERTGSPDKAIFLLMGCWSIALLVYKLLDLDIEFFLRMASINFLSTYIFIFFSAVFLPKDGILYKSFLLISLLTVVPIFIISYKDWLYPITIIGIYAIKELIVYRRK